MARLEKLFESGRAIEADYFHKKEQELIAKLRQRAAKVAERQGLAEETGISDEAILQTLEELGFSRDLVKVVHMFPLVAVAWADGEVSDKEKGLILQAAQVWGVAEGTPGHAKLTDWLEKRPDPAYADQLIRVIKDIKSVRQEGKQEQFETNILNLCTQVAEASGGFLGLGRKISIEEQQVIDRITREIATNHPDAARKVSET
ncbi:MAG: hypothetical protein IT186_00350 [Acidobacteria bacterium]|nr:hypothetical protein [Acidobacteriota bacterium]MCK6681713.1 hypothetical protein [Thermoanaerobaculia bacterium]